MILYFSLVHPKHQVWMDLWLFFQPGSGASKIILMESRIHEPKQNKRQFLREALKKKIF